jgi:ABC-type nitrate/sulfonate/bicarbonate transport system substrate-binding protein
LEAGNHHFLRIAMSLLRTGFFAAAALAFTIVSGPVSADEGQPDVVRLSETISTDAQLADELGYFKEQNIRIQWTGKQAHGPAVLLTVIAGENDFAGTVSSAVFLARSRGAKVKIIASQTLSTSKIPLFRYLVKDGSTIHGPEDLVGKTVAAQPTTITWYPMVVWLKRHGVDYHSVNFVSIPSPIAALQAFEGGQIDVLGGSEYAPPGSQLLEKGGVHFLPDVNDYAVLKLSQIGGWAAREDYLARHPDVVRRFIKALVKADRWGNAHPVEAEDTLSRLNGMPKQLWRYAKWRPTGSDTHLLVDRDSIEKWTRILEEFGQIAPGSIRPEDIYTNAYNPSFKPSSH